ncbi:MAG TPA: TetR family transcriptional regulator [Caulobacteraceae bacterium]|jgi:AcrR family transcriptional regulator
MSDLLDRAVDAALALARERPWGDIVLRDIAAAADAPLAQLYPLAPSKAALLDHMSRRFDLQALEAGAGDDLHDRLFDVVMARVEAMEPHRSALSAIARSEDPARLALRLPRTARALLEAAGVDTQGSKGAVRIAAMTALWTRVLQVWRDDEGALNRTMAEIDRRLRQMRSGLKRLGAGF